MAYNVRNAEIEATLRSLGKVVGDIAKKQLPPGWGFTLLMFNFGEEQGADKGMFYISNAVREDMIKSMEEFIKLNKH